MVNHLRTGVSGWPKVPNYKPASFTWILAPSVQHLVKFLPLTICGPHNSTSWAGLTISAALVIRQRSQPSACCCYYLSATSHSLPVKLRSDSSVCTRLCFIPQSPFDYNWCYHVLRFSFLCKCQHCTMLILPAFSTPTACIRIVKKSLKIAANILKFQKGQVFPIDNGIWLWLYLHTFWAVWCC